MHARLSFAWIVFLAPAFAFGDATFAPEPASGPPTITADYPSEGQAPIMIGKLKVTGAGRITFFASRDRDRMIVKALGAGGSEVGRAESVVGLGDTPIYIRSSRGSTKSSSIGRVSDFTYRILECDAAQKFTILRCTSQ